MEDEKGTMEFICTRYENEKHEMLLCIDDVLMLMILATNGSDAGEGFIVEV